MINPEGLSIPSFLKLKEFYNTYINISKKKTDVYLLGQGWFAKGFMEHIDKSYYKVTNITRFPFVNTPMLLQTVKPGHKSNSEQVGKFTKLVDKEIFADITSINLSSRQIRTTGTTYIWDGGYLVCGLGSNTDIGRYWTQKVNLLKTLTQNSKVCIVGAGPTGTELAFHLSDLGHKLTLYDALPQVYTFLTPQGAEHIIKKLSETEIKLYTSTMYTPTNNANFDQIIFAVGSRSNDLTSGWKITPQLNLKSNPEVFAGGDGIVQDLPKTAQVAYQQGEYVAKKLNGIATKSNCNQDFKFVPKGTALYTGNGQYYVEFVGLNKEFQLKIPEQVMEFYYKWLK